MHDTSLSQILRQGDAVSVGSPGLLEEAGLDPAGIDRLVRDQPNDVSMASAIYSLVTAVHRGSTGRVYRLRGRNRVWALKVRRSGFTIDESEARRAFAVELIRREELRELDLTGIAQTLFASGAEGYFVSEWIDGDCVDIRHATPGAINRARIDNCLALLFGLEKNGLFDWDLHPGNVLYCGDQPWLYDFGCMRRFDPLTEFNPNGAAEPFFTAFERYRDNHLFRYLIALDRAGFAQAARETYAEFAAAYVAFLTRRHQWLSDRNAEPYIIDGIMAEIGRMQGLAGNDGPTHLPSLSDQYLIDRYNSLKTTIEGHRFGGYFRQMADDCHDMIAFLRAHFRLLERHDALLWSDRNLELPVLIKQYQNYIEEARQAMAARNESP